MVEACLFEQLLFVLQGKRFYAIFHLKTLNSEPPLTCLSRSKKFE